MEFTAFDIAYFTIGSIYFILNSFLVGMIYHTSEWYTKKDYIVSTIVMMIFLFFGVLIVMSTFLHDFVYVKLIKLLDSYTQIRFFFSFYILKKYRNMSYDKLYSLNRLTLLKCRCIGEKYESKLMVRCIEIINKVNNFDPKSSVNNHNEEVVPIFTESWFDKNDK